MTQKPEMLKLLACLFVFCLCAGIANSQSNKLSTAAAQPQKKETQVSSPKGDS
jgi:hypothetical protein